MKQKSNAGHLAQRAVMTLVTAVIVAASSVVSVQAEVVKKSKTTYSINWGAKDVTITHIDSIGSSVTTSSMIYNIDDLVKMLGLEGDSVPKEKLANALIALQGKLTEKETLDERIEKEVAAKKKKAEADEREAKVERVYLFPKDCQLIKFDDPKKYSGMYYTFVIRHKEYTQVDIVTNVEWDWHWRSLSKVAYLLDNKTGDRYMLHSTIGDYPIEKTIVFRELKDKTTVITRIFPPLDKDVKMVTLVNVDNPDVVYPKPAMTEDPHNWNLKVYDRVEDLPYRLDVEGKVITLDADFKLPKKDSKLYR